MIDKNIVINKIYKLLNYFLVELKYILDFVRKETRKIVFL